jgi:cytochrome c biogenesis protein CcmG/thiol:disulfide interchange protein DsbE
MQPSPQNVTAQRQVTRRNRPAGLVASACLLACLITPVAESAGTLEPYTETRPTPELNLADTRGEMYRLEDYRGKVVLVNFWASWCPPCRSEMPAMQQVYDDFREEGFIVLAVNSTHQDNLGDAISFAQVHKLSFPILLDRDGSAGRSYDVRSLPTSFFIDRDGIIQDVVVGGPMSEALLRIRAQQLLGDDS